MRTPLAAEAAPEVVVGAHVTPVRGKRLCREHTKLGEHILGVGPLLLVVCSEGGALEAPAIAGADCAHCAGDIAVLVALWVSLEKRPPGAGLLPSSQAKGFSVTVPARYSVLDRR